MGRGRSPVGDVKIIENPLSFLDAENDEVIERFFGKTEMNQAQSGALWDYTMAGYSAINKYLRHGTPPADDEQAESVNGIKDIDSLIAAQTLNTPIKVIRGVDGAVFGLKSYDGTGEDLSGLVGSVFRDKGFTSTSVKYGAGFYGVQLEITVPSGKGRGVYVGKESSHPTENEYLLKRNSRFMITGYGKAPDGEALLKIQVID